MTEQATFQSFLANNAATHRSVSDYAADSIREAILTGVLTQGSPLRQETLAKDLSISRMPVREALRILQSEGLVDFRTNHGFTVSEFRAEQIIEIAEIRFSLESLALRHAIPNQTKETLRQVKSNLERLNEVENRDGLPVRPERHRQFHLSLYQPCRMERLLGMVETNLKLSESISRIGSSQFSFVGKRDKQEHQRLLTAIRNDRPEVAVDVLRDHIVGQAEAIASKLADLVQATDSKDKQKLPLIFTRKTNRGGSK